MAGRHGDPSLGLRVGLPVVGALALTAVVGALFPADAMTRWTVHPAVVAGVCWAGQLWYAGRGLETVRPWRYVFGAANTLTLLRGGLYAVVAGFLVVPATTDLAWVPAVCYGTGVALDKLDGTVARTIGEQTPLGTRLDMAFDTFGFVVAPLVAVLWGRLPVWYLSIAAARYVYLGGIRWRRLRGRPVGERPDSDLSKYLAGIQMVFLTVALVPVVPSDILFAVAPALLVLSLAVFARDFLVVSGRLPREWFDG
ncbi:CDP-alcohol phosphatidyltransferase family protein [Halorientalis litorea]|uniref:CDP-alcohol phosphatidyltransferase family protein n=1 Tax=Halorientalis litorea TaxID=2931977 RepID=UPI001FF23E94|nr:CDP-alcohol phosphatidyltransferase family protein [Halorientalis litorea]